jgi:hypothetical protein
MEHLYTLPDSSTRWRFARYSVIPTLLAAVAVRRDIIRRQAGIARRSPAEFVASALTHLGPVGRGVAGFLRRHNTTAYFVIALSIFLLFKYQQAVRRFLRRILRDNPTPSDALSDYAGSDDGLTTPVPDDFIASSSAVAPSEALRLLRGVSTEVDIPKTRTRNGSISSEEDEDHDEAEALRAAAEKAPPPSVFPGHEAPYPQHPPGAFLEQFLRLMRHTVQGISTRAVLSLYQRLERVAVSRGTVVFHAGDASTDGM